MITYTQDNKVALVTAADGVKTTVSVYASFEALKAAQAPLEVRHFNGPTNYTTIAASFDGWTPVCRDDSNWEIVECGPVPETPVPETISARQIRLWLLSNGISLAQIDALIDGIEDVQQREFTRVEWDYAPYIERTHPIVATFAAALGLTSEQVDAGFIVAAGL